MGDEGGGEPTTPNRMATRGVPRINYAELNTSGGGSARFNDENDDAVFRSPTASTRGKRRRPPSFGHDDAGSVDGGMRRGGRGRGGGMGGRGGRGGIRRSLHGDQEDKGLFGAVRSGRNLEAMVDQWVSAYEDDSDAAIRALLQFFVHSCGCRGVLTAQMQHDMEYSVIIKKLTEEFDEDTGDYPLMMSGPQFKRFRQNFTDMLHLLIQKCKSSIIFDQTMMDSVVQLLTGLADSQVRAFRHTATFAAMKISSALVDVTMELSTLKDRNQKLVEAEKAKVKQQKATNEKLDAFMQKKAEIEEKTEDLRSMLSFIYKSVFVHRYRDVLPDVRSICISEMGNWMEVYPDHFVEDGYLKYIGWTLHDKLPDVRLKCINALLPLYTRPEVAAKMELFTNKFKDRLVSMVMDKELEVAISSCKLVTNIYRVFPTLLSVKDCVPIYEQVYANHRALAVAAGEFLNCKVFQQGDVNTVEEQSKLILDLVQFFIEGEVHDHAAYLVDALIDTNPMMKEWKIMVDLLLSENLDGTLEGPLIQILVSAAKQASTGECPVGRQIVKRGAPAVQKEQRVLREERRNISLVLIPTLPQLLAKFMADREKVTLLMTLPMYFNLEVYMTSHAEKHVTELMEAIKDAMEKHTDDEVMSTSAGVLAFLSTNTLTNQATEGFRIGLIDTLALQLRTAVQRFNDEDQQLDEEDEAVLLSSFRKIAALLSHMELRRWELWDTILPVVVAIAEGKHAGREVLDLAVHCLSLSLQYELAKVVREESGKSDAIKKLKKRRDQFVHALESIMGGMASGVETAFNCLVDVLICFSAGIIEVGEGMKTLQVNVSRELGSKIRTFVEDNVFGETEEVSQLEQTAEIELMHRKRSLLSQFCKLVLHGVLPYNEAAGILTHYVKAHLDFGDILKLLLVKMNHTDRLQQAKCIGAALKEAYEQARARDGSMDPDSESFLSLKELAKRFATALGNDYKKARDPLAVIHRDAILYSLEGEGPVSPVKKKKQSVAPPNVAFLEVIMEFSHKLYPQDKRALYTYLDKHSPPAAATTAAAEEPSWQPYLLYKNSLTERADDTSSLHSFSFRGGRGRGGRPRGGGTRLSTPSEI